jgi:hypothetical protein
MICYYLNVHFQGQRVNCQWESLCTLYIYGCYGYIIPVHCYKSDSVASLYPEIMPYCVNPLKLRRTFSFGILPIFYRKNLKNLARPNFKTFCNTTYYLMKFYFKNLKCLVDVHVLLIYYVALRTLHDLMSYNAVVHTLRPPDRRGDYISYGGVYYLWTVGMEIGLCHFSDSWTFEVAPRFVENCCITDIMLSKCLI